MSLPPPPIISPFDEQTALEKVQRAEDVEGLMRKRYATSINDLKITESDRKL